MMVRSMTSNGGVSRPEKAVVLLRARTGYKYFTKLLEKLRVEAGRSNYRAFLVNKCLILGLSMLIIGRYHSAK